MITNLRYADDIILLATSEAELQELVNRLDRVSRKYNFYLNSDILNSFIVLMPASGEVLQHLRQISLWGSFFGLY